MKKKWLLCISFLLLWSCGSRVKYMKSFEKESRYTNIKVFHEVQPEEKYVKINEIKYKAPMNKTFGNFSVTEEIKEIVKSQKGNGAIIRDVKTKVPLWGYITAVFFYVPVRQSATVDIINFVK
ncbi:MAG: hypothetical protein ABIH68_04030 [bacterium]